MMPLPNTSVQIPQAPVAAPTRQPPGGESHQGVSTGIVTALKQIAEVGEKNQEWLQLLREHNHSNTSLLEVLIGILITMAEQQGIPPEMLAKLCRQSIGKATEEFLKQALSTKSEGKG